MDLNTATIELKGIGPKTVKSYEKLGLHKAEDFLYYYPRDYMKYDPLTTLSEECVDEIVFFQATVVKRPLLKRAGRMQIVTAALANEGTEVSAVWFHMPYLTKSLKVGETYVFRARIGKRGMFFHVEQPLIFKMEDYRKIEGTLQPIYALTKGLSNHALTKVIKGIFEGVSFDPAEDAELFSPKKETLYAMHFPADLKQLLEAREKLVYEEFFYFILQLRLLKEKKTLEKCDFQIYPSAYTVRLIEHLPYTLTGAQKKVWDEVQQDLERDVPMNRLVEGDVGSGKTIIALLSAVMVAANGHQTAIMAPTEILATQHFETIAKILKKEDIPAKAVLLTGSMSAATKRDIYEQIASGEAQIVIGTHALIQEKVNFQSLALVITDEQHRFGVRQRELLSAKNEKKPHVLVMSATPIPRTLAIILYGDLDLSVIDELPKRRLKVKNCVVNTDYRTKAYQFMEKEILNGRQAYVICPLVEESEGMDAENVADYAEKLKEVFAHDEQIRIGILHGKMKTADKNAVMDAFYRNDIQILVSTTVVEVGVNVPNATVMLIENAERFGLSQLHQLRGRIGRGEHQSYCIFMSANRSKHCMERLEVLNHSNDGFQIASEDLKQRGPGDLFGVRQSGDLHFVLGDVFQDAHILKRASADVDRLLTEDPDLTDPAHARLLDKLNQMDGGLGHTVL
ncbi:MAG: ATP-dependent DNA helicase RecG [Lachnospiraceae bacterium]|nr:ATP-dependent DNA helicase RecG [Lachnospiraceae bacterium]